MRFLIDQNLPEVLSDWLVANGQEASHVRNLGLADAPDSTIVDFAHRTGAVIVSKDADFAALGSQPVRLVWVQIGNTTNERLLAAWSVAWPQIISALALGEQMVELRGARAG
jgi:predicted nuclease of predicted toxin-antitoxin system